MGPPDRAIHGEVGAGVGTGGYRDIYGVAVIPLGDKGYATVGASETRFSGRRWGMNRQAYSLGVALGHEAEPARPWTRLGAMGARGCAGAVHDNLGPSWDPRWSEGAGRSAAGCTTTDGANCDPRSRDSGC